jgi:hypothetical protein
MSKYTTYYKARQIMYKDLAINWSKFTKDMNLTDLQRTGMRLFFTPIARRFGLIKEFKNIGVL